MKCAKCDYWDAVPGLRLCAYCAREPLPKVTNHQQQMATLQDTIDMLVRELSYRDETIRQQNTIIQELSAERNAREGGDHE